MNWATIIRQKRAITEKFAREVPAVLERDDVTLSEVRGLCIAVSEHHEVIGALMGRMANEGEAYPDLLEETKALDKVCEDLVAALLGRLSEIRRISR